MGSVSPKKVTTSKKGKNRSTPRGVVPLDGSHQELADFCYQLLPDALISDDARQTVTTLSKEPPSVTGGRRAMIVLSMKQMVTVLTCVSEKR